MSASAVLKLQKAGFTNEQVEALADFMDTQAASKADLEAAVHKLDLRFAEVDKRFAEARSDLEKLEPRMTIRLGTMTVLAVASVAALVKPSW